MTTTKQRLALSIINFLSTSLTDGTLSTEDSESVEIAQNCISDIFKVDTSKDGPAVKDSQSLLQIYTVYEKLKGTAPVSSNASSANTAPSEDQKKEAESLKSKGNAAMAKKDYQESIALYTQALALIPGNPIYLSNRAAAYSAAKDHESALADAEAATTADPKYTKAWSRLGLARFALGDANGSMEAYGRGIEEEKAAGGPASDAMRKGWETAKKRVEDEGDASEISRDSAGSPPGAGGMPDLSSLAGMFGGAGGGGGGGGGGMPDFGALMNNPMFKSMADKVMSDPSMMANIMNNPKLREMAGGLGRGGGGGGGESGAAGGGGGMPDLGSLMQDPAMMEMAKNLMGGGGGGAAGRGRGQ